MLILSPGGPKRQPIGSRSSTEAEYHATTEAEYHATAYTAAEIQWLRQLFLDLDILVQVSIQFFCDNIFATYLDANPVLHSRNKHIKVHYHFVRMVSKRHLQMKFIPTQPQVIDIFIKGLSLQKFFNSRHPD